MAIPISDRSEDWLVEGPAGRIEVVIDFPRGTGHSQHADEVRPAHGAEAAHGAYAGHGADAAHGAGTGHSAGTSGLGPVALIAHPHPLFGGSLDNKVVQTVAKTMLELGFVTLRPNFRGVGQSAGAHDEGLGETEDLLHLLEQARARFGAAAPVLCGYSFGGFVQARVAQQVTPRRMVLVGVANGRVAGGRDYRTPPVPPDTIVIHGELDETVPLANVFEWARPQDLPVTVVPGADHFFHRRLHLIRNIIKGNWADKH